VKCWASTFLSLWCAAATAGEPSPSPSPAGSLDGRILSRDGDRPLPGVTVNLDGISVISDGDGRFSFDALPPGPHHLQLRGVGAPAEIDEVLAPGERRSVVYRLQPTHPPRRFESTVRARVRREVVVTSVHLDEARQVAGTGGDALKVVQSLPGVARASFGGGQLVVWGAAPADTRVYVDGVEVPLLYHLGGFRSTVNEGLIRSLELVPGSQGAPWGHGLGGLVRLETRPLTADGIHGAIGADVLDASALLEAAIGKRFKIAAAGRYSYLDRILANLISADIGDYVPIPRWDDYQLKASWQLRPNDVLSFTFLGADDRLDRALPAADPAHARRDSSEQSFYRGSLRYLHADADAAVDATIFVGFDRALLSQSFGATPTRLGSDAWRYGARAEGRRRLARWAWLAIGVDLNGTRSTVDRVGSLTLPAREGDIYVFGQPPPGDVAAERFTIHQLDAAPWLQAEVTLGPVSLVPGLRADAVLSEGNHLTPPAAGTPVPGFVRLDWALEPRLAVSWRAHERVTVGAAGGLYHQPPDAADLSVVFGNPRLELQRAWHLTASIDVSLRPALSLSAAGFFKWLDGLVSRNPLPSPPIGRALVQDGSGTVFGGQLLLRARPWKGLSGWLSYTLSRSERQDHPTAESRLFDYDQTHVLALVANWQWRGLGLGLRLRWASGFPRTPVVGAFYDARDDQYQPLFGAHNGTRLPDFVQLDLRAEYALQWKRAGLLLYLDIQNLTDQANAEEVVYHADYSNFAQPGSVTGLPTTAVLGARVTF
jgi:hypothetical protein